jgi:hypothetical protein
MDGKSLEFGGRFGSPGWIIASGECVTVSWATENFLKPTAIILTVVATS